MSLADVIFVGITISPSPKESALLEVPLFNIFLSGNLGLTGNARLA